MSMSARDRAKRSSVRILSRTPRFTSVDFYIPPGGQPIDVPGLRGRAIQVISVLDYNRLFLPEINGTDTEHCHCTWNGEFNIDQVLYVAGSGVLNPAGTVATFAAVNNACLVTTLVTLPAGIITLGAFQLTGACQPSATGAVCNVAAGVQVLFPGGPAGAYTLNMPGFSGAVVPACPGDVSFDPAAAPSVPGDYTAESYQATDCTSTWNQPAAAGFTWPRVGYVHLNRHEDHIPVPLIAGSVTDGHLQMQAIPIPSAPATIRVEQEFDWIRIESASTIVIPITCMGIVIIENETENEVR